MANRKVAFFGDILLEWTESPIRWHQHVFFFTPNRLHLKYTLWNIQDIIWPIKAVFFYCCSSAFVFQSFQFIHVVWHGRDAQIICISMQKFAANSNEVQEEVVWPWNLSLSALLHHLLKSFTSVLYCQICVCLCLKSNIPLPASGCATKGRDKLLPVELRTGTGCMSQASGRFCLFYSDRSQLLFLPNLHPLLFHHYIHHVGHFLAH